MLLLWLQRVTRTLEEARFPEFYQEKITTPVRESGGGWCFSSRVICTTSLPAEHHTWWGCWEAGGHAPGPHKVFSAGGDFPHTEPGTPPKPGMDVPGLGYDICRVLAGATWPPTFPSLAQTCGSCSSFHLSLQTWFRLMPHLVQVYS